MQHEIGQASLQQDLKSLNQMKVMIPAEDFLGLKADLCSSGRHCCLFCNITKANMKVRPADLPKQPEPRSLQSLHNDYQDYTADGARPGLHISLGLFLKHFNSFEGACHDLDVLLANNTLQTNEETSKQFDTVSRALSRARQLESQAKELEDTAMLLREHLLCLDADDENVTIYSRMIQKHRCSHRCYTEAVSFPPTSSHGH